MPDFGEKASPDPSEGGEKGKAVDFPEIISEFPCNNGFPSPDKLAAGLVMPAKIPPIISATPG